MNKSVCRHHAKAKFNVLLLLLCMVLGWQTNAQANEADSLDWLSPYNQVWTSQSGNALSSMPVGGHDIGLNVWTQGNDVRFYIQRSGSIAENSEYLKLGRVRLTLTPNPFQGGSFRQELKLEEGYVEITGSRTVDGEQLQATVKVWVETERPVVRVDVDANRPVDVTAAYENWRLEDESLSNNHRRHAGYTLHAYPGSVTLSKDTVQHAADSVLFYHRNPNSDQVVGRLTQQQGLEAYADDIYDAIDKRTFGGVMLGDNFVADGETTGRYLNKNFRAWHLSSQSARNSHALRIVTHIDQTETITDWQDQLQQLVDDSANDLETARAATLAWWKAFWERSWISIQPGSANPGSSAWRMARNYNLFRYQLGTNTYGEYPTKFNGGNFTVDAALTNGSYTYGPDWRQWGGGTHTAQNQRLVYWPMLKSGDFDAMHSQFSLYRNGLGGAKARVKENFDHDGAIYSEYAAMSGLAVGSGYGWSSGSRRRGGEIPFGDSRANGVGGYGAAIEPGVMANTHIGSHFTSQLEHAYMILEHHRFSGEDISEYMPFIENSLVFFNEHYRKRESIRTGSELRDGKLNIYPSKAVETYVGAGNPVDIVSGLHSTLDALLKLDDGLFSLRDRDYYQNFRSVLPDLPWGTNQGRRVMRHAQRLGTRVNTENPQLYPLFPFNNFDLAGDDSNEMQSFRDTWNYEAQDKGNVNSWKQDGIFLARMGLDSSAASYLQRKFDSNSGRRFPTFWGPGLDWMPDHNWGGSAMIGLQEMVLQTTKDKIHVLPAWPEQWPISFKLHAPGKMIVQGDYDGGWQNLLVSKDAADYVVKAGETLSMPFAVTDHAGQYAREVFPDSRFVVTGDLVVEGTMKITGNAELIVSGQFINNGVLDISGWRGTLPADFINNGTLVNVEIEIPEFTPDFSMPIEDQTYQVVEITPSSAIRANELDQNWSSTSSSTSDGLWRERSSDTFGYTNIAGASNLLYELSGADLTGAPALRVNVEGLSAGNYEVGVLYTARNDGVGSGSNAATKANLNPSLLTSSTQTFSSSNASSPALTRGPGGNAVWSTYYGSLGTTGSGARGFTVDVAGVSGYNRSHAIAVVYRLIEADVVIEPPPLDTDGDGVADADDVFPLDPSETVDSDSDGIGDNADAFPNNPAESEDSDGDGVGDNADAFPNDAEETKDSDADGVGDNGDAYPDDPTRTEQEPVVDSAIVIDAKLDDWVGVNSFGIDAEDISGDNNPLDWKQAWMRHDENYLYLAYEQYREVSLTWGQTLYIDTDLDAGTGFQNGMAIGADYVVQADFLYRYSGNGSNWQWDFVAQVSSAYNGTVAEMQIEQASIGAPSQIRFVFVGGNVAYVGGTAEDLYPDGVYSTGSTQRYFEYSNAAPQNSAPVARDQLVSALPGISTLFTLDASDINGDNLSYEVVSDVSNGQITGTAPMLNYTSNTDFTGTDWFSYRVNDGLLDSAIATVRFSVSASDRYRLSNVASDIQIDGSLADWSELSSYTLDGAEIDETTDPIDWREAWIAHDESKFYLAYRFDTANAESIAQWGINAFIDADQDTSTGYAAGASIGADYLLQGQTLYEHTGADGNSWGWQAVSAVPGAVQGAVMELSLGRQWLGDPAEFDIYFAGDNLSLGGSQMDFYPDGVYDVLASTRYLSYTTNGLVLLNDEPILQAAEDDEPLYSRQSLIESSRLVEGGLGSITVSGSGGGAVSLLQLMLMCIALLLIGMARLDGIRLEVQRGRVFSSLP